MDTIKWTRGGERDRKRYLMKEGLQGEEREAWPQVRPRSRALRAVPFLQIFILADDALLPILAFHTTVTTATRPHDHNHNHSNILCQHTWINE
mmetsp:Transcript_3490/g.9275  ORF Transcript_3490/g.9275 Transcript_3490/m.9275 type:complete len:93 (-) Transcript_3490:283-561(-)